ncbi:MAG: LutB/LldF family L-lactate oxidation iron-sulfur protein [Rhodospirillales bacterium]
MSASTHDGAAPVSTGDFSADARRAIADEQLQTVLSRFSRVSPASRAETISRLPEFELLRDAGKAIKDHALANLDVYLEQFEAAVTEAGGQVHWCRDAAEARATVLQLCRDVGARTVTKSKSMATEEIGLNDYLEEHGIEPVETDLGEYIIQLRKEPPSHIIMPAIHLNRQQVADTFRAAHDHLPPGRKLEEPRIMLDEAREELRSRFLGADVGMTGANMLIAETGSIVVVTNEGNADLTMTLPKTHIAVSTIEKIVPTLDDAMTVLRLLARSATGQDITVYSSFVTGPKRAADPDGPETFHMVLIDNGRSAMFDGGFRDMLRCIRCGSCMNHCPVYTTVGGHAYNSMYEGPMGSVLTPGLRGLASAGDLPNASTLCGKCETVCPMKIPLPQLLRRWRQRQHDARLNKPAQRWGLGVWSFLARRAWLYRIVSRLGAVALRVGAKGRGRLGRWPLAGGWTAARDLAAPSSSGGETFMAAWRRGQRR